MAIAQKTAAANRYRPEPSVWKAIRTPRILTREVLAGLVVAMALIPEAISFSIIAGVDPRVGRHPARQLDSSPGGLGVG